VTSPSRPDDGSMKPADHTEAKPKVGLASSVVLFATLNSTLAMGVDFVLPAFVATRQAFNMPSSSSAMSLAISVYFLGLAGPQIVYGPFADRFGRRPVLRVSYSVYIIGAVGAALAPSFGWLLVARFLAGVGAAGARSLAVAIARDLHQGDRLARVMALGMGLFMLVPILAPLGGQLALEWFGHRWVFVIPVLPALAIMAWSFRLPETMPPGTQRPLSFQSTWAALRTMASCRLTVGYTVVTLFDFASFASFLSSTELLFDSVYDRSNDFARFMALMGIINAIFVVASSRLIGRSGSHRLLLWSLAITVLAAGLLAGVALNGAGSPSFWLWFGILTVVNSIRTFSNSLSLSGAMNQMGELAGTAAAVIGAASIGGGTLLAMITDRFQAGTVTPLALAYFGYGILGFGAAWWAGASPPQTKTSIKVGSKLQA